MAVMVALTVVLTTLMGIVLMHRLVAQALLWSVVVAVVVMLWEWLLLRFQQQFLMVGEGIIRFQ